MSLPTVLKTSWQLAMESLDDFMTTKLLCLVHVIWTERRMLKLVLNVKYLLLLSFLIAAKFYNLGRIQGCINSNEIISKMDSLYHIRSKMLNSTKVIIFIL